MDLEKVCGNPEARMIPFCFGRQKQAGEGWLRGSGGESVPPVHPAEDMTKVQQVQEIAQPSGSERSEQCLHAVNVGKSEVGLKTGQ